MVSFGFGQGSTGGIGVKPIQKKKNPATEGAFWQCNRCRVRQSKNRTGANQYSYHATFYGAVKRYFEIYPFSGFNSHGTSVTPALNFSLLKPFFSMFSKNSSAVWKMWCGSM